MPVDLAINQLTLSRQELQKDPTAFQRTLERTYQIFCMIKENRATHELRLCAEIASLCAQHITKDSPYHALFTHAMSMQSFYVAHNKHDREVLVQYVNTHDQYLATMSDGTAAFEGLSELLDKVEELSDEKAVDEAVVHDTEIDIDALNSAVAPLAANKVASTDVMTNIQSIRQRFENAQDMPHNSKRKRAFKRISDEMLSHAYAVKACYPLASQIRYYMDGTVIQDLQFALQLQAAYIFELRNNEEDTFEQSKALQNAAFLFRTFNAYYQRSDASPELKASLRAHVEFMQKQSSNIRSVLVCGQVMASEVSSPDEKARIAAQEKKHLALKEQGLDQICSTYNALMGPAPIVDTSATQFNITLDTITPATYGMLEQEFYKIQASIPAFSFVNLLDAVSDYLAYTLMQTIRIPNAAPSEYLKYVDEYCPGESVDVSQTTLVMPEHAPDANILLNALELYYKVKMASLDEARFALSQASVNDQFVVHERFIRGPRLLMYRDLLAPMQQQNLPVVKQNCEYILSDPHSVTTPLINALATHRLRMVNSRIREQLLQEMNVTAPLPSDVDVSLRSPQKPLSTTAKKRLQKKKKREAAILREQVEARKVQSLEEAISSQIEKEYADTTLSAPDWMALKTKVIDLVKKEQFMLANDLLDRWIRQAEMKEVRDVLTHKGVYDGYLHKVMILRRLGDYEGARQCLVKAWDYVAPEATHPKIYHYQLQHISIERAKIRAILGDDAIAEIALDDADKHAKANDTFCFYNLWQSLSTWLGKMELLPYESRGLVAFHGRVLSHHQSEIDRLLSDLTDLFVDEYSLVEFYLFYEKLAHLSLNIAIDHFKTARAREALGEEHKAIEKTATHYADQVINILSVLLEYSMRYAPDKVMGFEVRLAVTYRELRTVMPSPPNQHYKDAKTHLNNALALVKRRGNTESSNDLRRIHEERESLKAAILLRNSVVAKTVSVMQERQQYQALQEKSFFRTLSRIPLPAPSFELQQEEMLQAMKTVITLCQFRAITQVIRKFIPNTSPFKEAIDAGYQQFDGKVVSHTLDALGEIGKSIGFIMAFCGNFPSLTTRQEGAPPDNLIRLYIAQSHYLAHMMRMANDKKEAQKANIIAFPEELLLSFTDQMDVVGDLGRSIDQYQQENSNIPEYVIEQCKQNKSKISDEMINYCLLEHTKALPTIISNEELTRLKAIKSMPLELEATLYLFDKKQYWMAFMQLFWCLQERADVLTPSQTQEVHLLIAKIMHWNLTVMCSLIAEHIETPDEKAYFKALFSQLKLSCWNHSYMGYDKERDVNEKRLNADRDALQEKIKALHLPELKALTDTAEAHISALNTL
ncbi:MAG: hypothetical protein P1U32_08755 [Legionellaceae bacterium]|nr:hypothetical protein [Legionellaceae bacterium]